MKAIKSSYSREKCTDAEPAQQVLTIVGTFKNALNPELALSRYLENNFKFVLPGDEEKMLKNFTTLPGNWTSQVKFTNDIKNDILNVEDPYVFFAFDHNDFDIEDANFERMIEQAENQNADVVAGAYRDEFGHWDQSCLHIHLQNYTLDVWTGYYKSHLGMKESFHENKYNTLMSRMVVDGLTLYLSTWGIFVGACNTKKCA